MDNLIQKLKKVKDFRRAQGKRHSLWFILLLIVLALMLGYTSYRGMEKFAQINCLFLTKKLKINPKRVPSYSTIKKVVDQVEWCNLVKIFNEWAGELVDFSQEIDTLAIDGKTLKSTVTNYHKSSQNFISMVSQFSQNTAIAINLSCWENKHDSEINQVQDMVKASEFEGQILTLDALHCQTETLRVINESNNDYLVTVKKNQKKLYESLERNSKIATPVSTYEEIDLSHGRQVTRKISVFSPPLDLDKKWVKVKSYLQIERKGFRDKKPYYQVLYYLSSLKNEASYLGKKIRGHWLIENQLHWVKDVIFSEDKVKIVAKQANINLSILKTIALNLFRFLGFLSITDGRIWLLHRWRHLSLLLE
jgi:predicted transposase YbfD/YdcC